MNNLANTFYTIGYNGPYILFVTAILLIIYDGFFGSERDLLVLGKQILLVFSWNVMNLWLNGILKGLIKEPRPEKMIKINQHDEEDSRQYGMPSGHAQIAANNLVFIALLLHNDTIIALSILQTLTTIYQRYSFRMHSVSQLLAGTAVGGISGYVLYKIYEMLYDPSQRHPDYLKTFL